MAFLVVLSFWQTDIVGRLVPTFSLANYQTIFQEGVYSTTIQRTLIASTLVLGTAFVLAVPTAYFMAKVVRSLRVKGVLLVLLSLPFLVGPMIRIIGLSGVLSLHGAINTLLTSLGLIHAPLEWLLFSDFAVFVGLVYSNFGLLLFAAWLSFELIPDSEIAAARDLGASRSIAFWRVTAPRAAPGLIAGAILTFVPVAGALLEPQRLGGTTGQFVGAVIGGQFLDALDWPLGSALAVLFFAISAVAVGVLAIVLTVILRTLARWKLF
jgi:spermidine/putrescine transport system permease protein